MTFIVLPAGGVTVALLGTGAGADRGGVILIVPDGPECSVDAGAYEAASSTNATCLTFGMFVAPFLKPPSGILLDAAAGFLLLFITRALSSPLAFSLGWMCCPGFASSGENENIPSSQGLYRSLFLGTPRDLAEVLPPGPRMFAGTRLGDITDLYLSDSAMSGFFPVPSAAA